MARVLQRRGRERDRHRWRWSGRGLAAGLAARCRRARPGAVGFALLLTAVMAAAPAPALAAVSGAEVFAQNCSGCHGRQGEGKFGPPLAAAGFASLVGPMVERGGFEMPAFAGVLSPAEVEAVAGHVAGSLAEPEARRAEVAEGGELYRLYCAGCHGATGRGGALTHGRNAPDISQYPPGQALAAMLLGRGDMPAFAGNTFDVRQQTAVALYVQVLESPPSPGGAGLGYLGPVTEGVAAAFGLVLLIALAVWLAWKSRGAAA